MNPVEYILFLSAYEQFKNIKSADMRQEQKS